MAIKSLQGIRIEPKGNRFQTQNWPNGFAFGGWIYSAEAKVGLSKEASSVSLSIVLANLGELGVADFNPNPLKFDISKEDLRLGSTNGSESLFDISVNGKQFEDFVLYSYEVDISPERKLLKVEFRDYSVILDKIYVGLINRQGNKFVHRGIASGNFIVQCADCQENGSTFLESSDLVRDVSFGSYAGLNGITIDNFANVVPSLTSPFSPPLTPAPSPADGQGSFNLNGGYLILGTEDIPQEICGSLPEVKYSFPELVWSLQNRGIKLAGEFPQTYNTQTLYYRQNYIGTLREVLQNWCSDFALDFYTSGKTLEAYSIKEPIDISPITGILDPTSSLGSQFDLRKDNAVGSYRETASLDNSFEQSVITYSTKPAKTQTNTKNTQRHVGYIPMHPIDFNYSNLNIWNIRQNAYGLDFITEAHLNDFDVCNPSARSRIVTTCDNEVSAAFTSAVANRYDRFSRWTNRTFGDIDTSMALQKYDPTLRDIFAGTRIIESLQLLDPTRSATYNVFNAQAKKDFDANFKALGYQPITRVLDPELKEIVLSKFKKQAGNVIDQKFFEIYIGYYFEKEHEAVKSWESQGAESMYKYGFLIQGTNNTKPYVTKDFFYNLSPEAGLAYGTEGIKRTVYSHTYEPSTQQYPALQDAPFYNLIPFTGVHPIDRYTGAFIAQLDNIWGTSKEEFDKSLEFPDQICQNYTNASVNERLNDLEGTTKQTWDIKYFAPSFHADIDELYSDFEEVFEKLAITNNLGVDQISVAFYNQDGEKSYQCQKLHFCIIPITTNSPNSTYACHANGRFNFNPHCGSRTINPEMYLKYHNEILKEQEELNKEEIPSICDLKVSEELCKKALVKRKNEVLSGAYSCLYSKNDDMSKYYCDIDPTGHYRVGFHPSYLDPVSNPLGNSRFLDVTVERNPAATINSTFVPTDAEGNIYLEDLADPEVLTTFNYNARTARIVYPIYSPNNELGGIGNYDNAGHLYYGLMKTTIREEIRSPQSVEIYGEPVNKIGNGASSIKVINNEISPDLDPILDGTTNKFITYTSLITGDGIQSVVKISDYHSIVQGLNGNSSNKPMDSLSFSLLGESSGIARILNPKSGLSSFSISIGDEGVKTDLEFRSKGDTLPKQESVLNNITARLPKN